MSTINSIPTPTRPTPAAQPPKSSAASPEAKRPTPAANPAETSYSFSSASMDLLNKNADKESV